METFLLPAARTSHNITPETQAHALQSEPQQLSHQCGQDDRWELPTCPVCLERIDSEISGVMTILCHHHFHGDCLSKWGDGSCPVCRYTQSAIPEAERTQCNDCDAREGLWMCLICGNTGCGRYQNGHAHRHFKETQHLFALELETQRVWDYIGDGYVHRLIMGTSGKMVELPGPTTGATWTTADVAAAQEEAKEEKEKEKEKMDAMGLEYSNILTAQLDSQRLFYEAQLERIEIDAASREAALTERLQEAMRQINLRDAAQRTIQGRAEGLEKRMSRLGADLSAEKAMNENLVASQALLKKNIEEKEAALLDAQDQLRDVMFYLQAQEKVSRSAMKDELMQGSIQMGPQEDQASSSSRKKGRGGGSGKRRGKKG